MSAIPSSTSAATTASGVVAIAITSTFIPPPECTQNSLSMLEDQQYFIWLNAPVPIPQSTVSSCYPSQFMSSFLLSVAGTSQPAFSPLVCPQNYVTALNSSSYIACCPSDYTLAVPTVPSSDRPAFGGTCYSDIALGETVTVTTYDNSTLLATSTWSPTTSGAQAYAYAMDGFANETSTTASSTFATSIPTSTSNPSTIAPTASSSPSSGISTKDHNIGIGVGVSFGCVALGLLAYFLWRWRKQKQRAAELEEQGGFDRKSELPGPSPTDTKETSITHEMSANSAPREMPANEMPVELPTHSD